MFISLRLALLAAFSLVSLPILAQPAPKWGAHVDMEGKLGTERSLGEGDLFAPLLQNDDSLLFASIRARFDDRSSQEGNFGLGYRHMLESGWNLGVYGYYDRRRTGNDNRFNQATVGVEALGQDIDLRANLYKPFGRDRADLGSSSAVPYAELTGTMLEVITPASFQRFEQAMGGFDAEAGWRVPAFAHDDPVQWRVFAGGFRFTGDGVDDVAGPRLRMELALDSVPYLWEGSRLTLGAEWQDDDIRGSQGFASLRLRLPLQNDSRPASRLSPQEHRMAEPVVRDIDIVASAGTVQTRPEKREAALDAASGNAVAVLDASIIDGADLPAAVAAAGANSTVLLQGDHVLPIFTAITLNAGQTLTGLVTLTTASGATASFSSGATLTATDSGWGGDIAVTLASNSTVSHLTISGETSVLAPAAASGGRVINSILNGNLVVNGSSNLLVQDNVITGGVVTHSGSDLTFRNNAIHTTFLMQAGSRILIENNRISGSDFGILLNTMSGAISDITLRNNRYDNISQAVINITGNNALNLTADSVGNSWTGTGGGVFCNSGSFTGTLTGSIGFGTQGDCP